MTSPATDCAERVRKRRVQIDLTQRRFSGEVIAASPQGQRATRNQKLFEIHDQRSTNAAATLRLVHDDRVQLPHEAVVFPNSANPADDGSVASDRNTADAIRSDRVQDFLPRFGNRRPNAEWRERSVEHPCGAFDPRGGRGSQILNREFHEH